MNDENVTLIVLAGGNFVQLGLRLLIGAIVPLILLTFETTKSNVGLALTGMWMVYALLQFPSGILADRYGERRVLIVGLAGAITGSVLVAFSPTLLYFGVFLVLLGAGAGLFFSPASALVSRLYKKKGGPLGVLSATGAMAGLVFPAVGGAVGDQHGWRSALALAAIVTLPLLVGSIRLVPSNPPVNPDLRLKDAANLSRLEELLTRPSIAYTTALAIIAAFTFQATSSFLSTFLVEYRNLSTTLAGVIFGAVFGLSALAQPVAGHISDRFSRDIAIMTSLTLGGVGFIVLLTVPGRAGLVTSATLIGIGLSWQGPVQARFMDALAQNERGYGFGLVRTVYMMLAASASVIVGTLAETSGWIAGFGTVVVLLVIGLVMLGSNLFR